MALSWRLWVCLLLVAGSLSVAGHGAHAATINAANCSPTAVQNAVNSAAPGDTVHLPTCDFAGWATEVLITTRIILEGNGTANTILRTADPYDGNMFRVSGVTGFEMRNITLDGTFDTAPNQNIDTGLYLENCVDFRVHHATFQNLAMGINVTGDPTVQRGLIDHNTFFQIFFSDGTSSYGYAVVVYGNGTYPALSLGTATNIFIEDNTITDSREAVDANEGARFVFRYNTSTNNGENAAHVGTHGWEAGGFNTRGTRQAEVYNNTIGNVIPKYGGIDFWGGDGVVFNNTFGSNITQEIQLDHQTCGTYPLQDQIRDLYLWNNNLSAGGAAPIYNHCTSSIQLNRDYFLAVRPGYTSYTYPHPAQGAAGTAPVVVLSATPSLIAAGQSSTLSWSSTDATSCTASGGWTGTKGTTGSQSVSPLTTTVYTLTCTGAVAPDGADSETVTVTTTAPVIWRVSQ